MKREGIKVPFEDADQMRDIYSMLRRPKPIVETAEKFIQEIIAPQDTAREYMAVHWRFEAAGGEFGGKVQSLCRTQNVRFSILNIMSAPSSCQANHFRFNSQPDSWSL